MARKKKKAEGEFELPSEPTLIVPESDESEEKPKAKAKAKPSDLKKIPKKLHKFL